MECNAALVLQFEGLNVKKYLLKNAFVSEKRRRKRANYIFLIKVKCIYIFFFKSSSVRERAKYGLF